MNMILTRTDTEEPSLPLMVAAYDLICDGHISVASMCWAAIPHPVKLTLVPIGHIVWSIPYLRGESGLLVESGILDAPLEDKVLITRVFNLTSKPIKIKPGTLVARLFCTAKE